jgi:hypothetical protein
MRVVPRANFQHVPQGRRDYKQCESLTVKVNVYDLVWETKDHRRGKNAGLVDLGLGSAPSRVMWC